jgi:hypothetical protein
MMKIDISDAVRGELVEPCTALRQAQGERTKLYFLRNIKTQNSNDQNMRVLNLELWKFGFV